MAVISSARGFELRGERSSLRVMLRDLWASRSLIRMLARKDFFSSYRRASLGLVWAVGLPVIHATVLSLVFSQIVRIRIGGGRSFPVFIYAGVVAWSFFSGTIQGAVSSIVGGASLSTRIYFPRAVLPLEVVVAHLYTFVPALGALIVMVPIFGVPIGPRMLLLVPAVALLLLLTISFSLLFAAMQVYFRDVRWIIAAVLQPWFYASGVFFPLRLAPKSVLPIIKANPAVGMIQLFRAATVGADPGWETALYASVGWAVGLLGIALLLYRRYDRVFPDRL